MAVEYIEPALEARMKKAKERAQKIINGKIDNVDDLTMALRLFLSRIYHMPIHHSYFEGLTLDQLVFEVELHRTERLTTSEKTNEIINENKQELAGMFDDWETQDTKDILNSADNTMSGQDSSFDDEAKKFMETGEFKHERNE